eukprot:TRINITY_DN10754_c0_g1_i1.p2 TRINITY_DN10754_c0_g1~~TRINITY_DN10754_c0_g1_i1.p2  ORF type:complete len:179 (-),score=69.46 TRINITY_DN10754_c0_g1_i1:116-652(-)
MPDTARLVLGDAEQAAEAVRQAVPGHQQLVSQFAQREVEMKRVQQELEANRSMHREQMMGGVQLRQNQLNAALERDGRALEQLQAAMEEQKRAELEKRGAKAHISDRLRSIETERLRILEESKTHELEAMHRQMETLEKLETSKRAEIDEIEGKIADQIASTAQSRQRTVEQLSLIHI